MLLDSVSGYMTGTSPGIGTVGMIAGPVKVAPDAVTWNSYGWYDGAVVSQLRHRSDALSSATEGVTTYSYGASGDLRQARVVDGRSRTVTYTNDVNGQAIRRREADNNGGQGDPLSLLYRFGGREMVQTANVADPSSASYTASIDQRTAYVPPSSSTYSFYASGIPDGDLSYEAVNSYRQGSSGGQYTIRAGDTLEGIALASWGDAALWYKIAEANGLSSASVLIAGQVLRLPAGVMRSSHNAATFKPYDPSQAMGDTAPTAPKPPKKKKCGILGAVLMSVIAVAVAVAVAAPFGGGAVAGIANIDQNGAPIKRGGSFRPFPFSDCCSSESAAGLTESAVTLVTDKAEGGDARSLDDVQHAGRQLIAGHCFRFELQFGFRSDLQRLLKQSDQLTFGNRIAVPKDLIGLRQDELVLIRLHDHFGRIRLRLRQVDIDRVSRNRDGDDEHDEENEHDVDQRRRVHFHHRAAIVLAA